MGGGSEMKKWEGEKEGREERKRRERGEYEKGRGEKETRVKKCFCV